MFGSSGRSRLTFDPSSLSATRGSFPSASAACCKAYATKATPYCSNSRIREKVMIVLIGTHPSLLQAVREKKYLSMGRLESEK